MRFSLVAPVLFASCARACLAFFGKKIFSMSNANASQWLPASVMAKRSWSRARRRKGAVRAIDAEEQRESVARIWKTIFPLIGKGAMDKPNYPGMKSPFL
jgi:hypothetical protein